MPSNEIHPREDIRARNPEASRGDKHTQKDFSRRDPEKQKIPGFAQESAEKVFERRGENVKILGRNSDREFNIRLTAKDGKITEGSIDLKDIKEKDPELYKDLEYNTKIHYLDHFMHNENRNVSDVKIVNGEYTFKDEKGQETKLTKNEREAFEEKLKGEISSFGFDTKNLDIRPSVGKAVLEKAKNLPESQGGGNYDTVYDYDEKNGKWYLQKDGRIKEVEFDEKDQIEILKLNAAIKHLKLEENFGEIASVKGIGYGKGYRVTDAKGKRHEIKEVSRETVRKINNEVGANTLGDSPLSVEEKREDSREKRWDRVISKDRRVLQHLGQAFQKAGDSDLAGEQVIETPPGEGGRDNRSNQERIGIIKDYVDNLERNHKIEVARRRELLESGVLPREEA